MPGSGITTNTYRADGLRHQKEDSTGTTRFVYDGQAYLAETDGSNVIRAVYTNEPAAYGGLISQRRDLSSIWTPSYYHFDAVGSARGLTDATQNMVASYLQNAFGGSLNSSSLVNPFRFVGQVGYYFDENTGLFNVRQRVYDSTLARWISKDPIGVVSGDLNLYRYVTNNPIGHVDPSGLIWRYEKKWSLASPHLKESGSVICDKDGDTLGELIRLITGSASNRVPLKPGYSIHKKYKAGQRVYIRSLLRFNEIQLRANVVAAARLLQKSTGAQFPGSLETYEDGSSRLNARKISEFFISDGRRRKVDCLGAAKLVEAKGLIDTLQPGEFDRLYDLTTIPLELRKGSYISAQPGDWGYIKNYPDYLIINEGGGYQGENVIKMDAASVFWGYPDGEKKFRDWVRRLKEEYGARTKDPFPGWLPENNVFLDVVKISEDAFQLRGGIK